MFNFFLYTHSMKVKVMEKEEMDSENIVASF